MRVKFYFLIACFLIFNQQRYTQHLEPATFTQGPVTQNQKRRTENQEQRKGTRNSALKGQCKERIFY